MDKDLTIKQLMQTIESQKQTFQALMNKVKSPDLVSIPRKDFEKIMADIGKLEDRLERVTESRDAYKRSLNNIRMALSSIDMITKANL